MIPSRHFISVLTLLLGAGALVPRAPLGAQIAVNGTVAVTLNVPVQVASVDPKFTQLNVSCVMQSGADNWQNGANPAPAPAPTVARGTVVMTNGAYSGTVPVQVTMSASSGQVLYYRCQFNLLDSGTGKYWINATALDPLPPAAEGRLQALAKPGAQLALEQHGSFTVQ